jgi:hypothetical protein
MVARAKTECDHCGGYDDHPKVHIGTVTKHHDCLSVAEKGVVTEHSPAAADIIAACESGTRGPDLLDYIESVSSKEEVK